MLVKRSRHSLRQKQAGRESAVIGRCFAMSAVATLEFDGLAHAADTLATIAAPGSSFDFAFKAMSD